jgi:signal transduction histidine kinase
VSGPAGRGLARLSARFGASLRARLTAAFAAIILVSVLLAGAAFTFILRDYQLRAEFDRVAELALPLAFQARSLNQVGVDEQQIAAFLQQQADELGLRIILANPRGTVLADSEERLVGQQLRSERQPSFALPRRVRQATADGPDGEQTFLLASPLGGPEPGGGRFGRASPFQVGLGVPQHSLAAAWLELLPRLALAALLALVASIALAWPLAASIARPLTAMTQAAEAIARGRYEQRIEARGRDEVARLARAFNRMAREVSAAQRTRRDFLANVSHDLRTPLTSIQGFSQALTDGTLRDPAGIAEAGRIVHQEASRMSRLVDDLLLLSRIESGQAPLERRQLELAGLLAERIEAAAPRAVEAGLALDWQPSVAPPILADRSRLERTIDNLLDNALRHTPPGGRVTVRLESARVAAANGADGSAEPPLDAERLAEALRAPGQPDADDGTETVVIAVHNTGSTIPPEDLPRVFERFYQLDKARSGGSSGLGLAIIHEIVAAHGGRCWAESSPEYGTTFFVQLPVLSATLADETTGAQRPETGPVHPPAIPIGPANQTLL